MTLYIKRPARWQFEECEGEAKSVESIDEYGDLLSLIEAGLDLDRDDLYELEEG